MADQPILLPIIVVDLPTFRSRSAYAAVPNLCAVSRIFNQTSAIILSFRDHSPKDTRHFVGQGDGGERSLLTFQELA